MKLLDILKEIKILQSPIIGEWGRSQIIFGQKVIFSKIQIPLLYNNKIFEGRTYYSKVEWMNKDPSVTIDVWGDQIEDISKFCKRNDIYCHIIRGEDDIAIAFEAKDISWKNERPDFV